MAKQKQPRKECTSTEPQEYLNQPCTTVSPPPLPADPSSEANKVEIGTFDLKDVQKGRFLAHILAVELHYSNGSFHIDVAQSQP